MMDGKRMDGSFPDSRTALEQSMKSIARRVAVLGFAQLRISYRRFRRRKDVGTLILVLMVAYAWGIVQVASAAKTMPTGALRVIFSLCYSVAAVALVLARSASSRELAAFCAFHAVLKRERHFAHAIWKISCILAFTVLALPYGFLSASALPMIFIMLGSILAAYVAASFEAKGRGVKRPLLRKIPMRINIARLVCGSLAVPGIYATMGFMSWILLWILSWLFPLIYSSISAKADGFLGAAILFDAFVNSSMTLDDSTVARANVVRPFPRSWAWWLKTAYASEFLLLLAPRIFICMALTVFGRSPVPFIAAAVGMSILSPCFFDPKIIQLVISVVVLVFAQLLVINGYFAMYSLILAEAAVSVFLMRKYFVGVLYDGRSLERINQLR